MDLWRSNILIKYGFARLSQSSEIYNPRKKSLAHLNQIARKCVDKALIPHDIIRIEDPLPPPPTMLQAGNDDFITITNTKLGGRGRRQLLQKWQGVPRLLSKILARLSGNILPAVEVSCCTVSSQHSLCRVGFPLSPKEF